MTFLLSHTPGEAPAAGGRRSGSEAAAGPARSAGRASPGQRSEIRSQRREDKVGG